MAERAIANEVDEQASAAAKAENETEEVQFNVPVHEAANTSVKEVSDEVCPDAEYGSKTEDVPKAVSNPVPPPVRDRSLGGIDYYLLSYDDPIFEDEHY